MCDINQKISEIGVVPVIKLNNPERDAANLAKALCEGGVPVAEVTFRAAGADIAIRLMREACPDMLVGAGTVLTTEQVDKALSAGAQFIVTPGFDPELVAYCQEKGLPIYPGCTTPTDYHAALKFGLKVLKFFPAEASGGVNFLKSLIAPYKHLGVRFMPTGGITTGNVAEYLAIKEVVAVGGTWLGKSSDIESGNWDGIRAAVKAAVELSNAC